MGPPAATPSGSVMPLQPVAVDESSQLVVPTMECLPGLTAIADEMSERWITPRPDGEVMQRWLARIIESNGDGRNARFCVHHASDCAGVVGFSSLDPIRISWWVGAPWRGTGLAESACRAVLGWLGTTRALTVVEATVHPHNAASLSLADRLGFRDGGSVSKIDRRTGKAVQHRRLVLTHGGSS